MAEGRGGHLDAVSSSPGDLNATIVESVHQAVSVLGNYYVDIKIGTPPVDQILIFDTGSDLWVREPGGGASMAALHQTAVCYRSTPWRKKNAMDTYALKHMLRSCRLAGSAGPCYSDAENDMTVWEENLYSIKQTITDGGPGTSAFRKPKKEIAAREHKELHTVVLFR